MEPGTESRWTEPPFEGRIAGGYVWGRGALDDKEAWSGFSRRWSTSSRRGQAAAHRLPGVRPRRRSRRARGAARIADLLASRNVHPELVLDEGGALAIGLVAAFRLRWRWSASPRRDT